jgi:hypothetical protein
VPYQETQPTLLSVLSHRGYIWGRITRRAVRKRDTSGVDDSSELLGEPTTAIPRLPEIPYMISSTGPYHTEEKIILRVTIQGYDNTEHYTTAMIDCGATKNFIDL